jgi:hypothetical protein
VSSGREAHGKENPRKPYAVGLRTEPASLVPRQLPTDHDYAVSTREYQSDQPSQSRLDRDSRCLLRKIERREGSRRGRRKKAVDRSFHIRRLRVSPCPTSS